MKKLKCAYGNPECKVERHWQTDIIGLGCPDPCWTLEVSNTMKDIHNEEWRERLQAEVMEDYIMHAEMRHMTSKPYAHMELMRKYYEKLLDFISKEKEKSYNEALEEGKKVVEEKYGQWVHSSEFHGFGADRIKKDCIEVLKVLESLKK